MRMNRRAAVAALFLLALPLAAQFPVPGTGGGGGGGGGGTVTSVTAGPSGGMTCTGAANILCDLDTAYVMTKTGANAMLGIYDASGATRIIPQKMDTSWPPTCTKGERFWHTTWDIEATCTDTNVWSFTGGTPGKFSRIVDEFCGSDNYPDASITGERWFKIGSLADPTASQSNGDHPCALNVYVTGANNSSGIALRYNSSANDARFGTLSGLNNVIGEFHFIFRIDATTQVVHRVGLTSSLETAVPTHGIYAQYSNNSGCTATGSDTGWVYTVRASGTSSTASGPSLTAPSWVHLRIRSLTAGTWLFAVSTNGGAWSTEQSLSTNVPSASLAPSYLVTSCESAYKWTFADLYHGFVASSR